MIQRRSFHLPAAVLALILSAVGAHAATTDCATDWNNFQNNPGFIAEYTSDGFSIADHETSSDPSNGGTGVEPDSIDLSSGSPGGFPGAFTTPFFGYYNGGTIYDPDDPVTLEDDYIFFRMRVEADPSQKVAFISRHWNVLLDIDDDGYKEFWIDLDGTLNSNNNPDRLQILYDNSNQQDISDPDAVRVDLFTARNDEDNDPSCPASSPGLSHTRVIPADDGVDGDFWVEIQVPMTALNDLAGNQVVFPDSPVAFVFSTSASNSDPLQKDFMQDLDFLSLSDPITFGDVVIPNGRPQIAFTDGNGDDASFYVVGDQIFLTVVDRFANTDPNLAECITVTVTNPAVGDDETVTLCETGPNSGTFTNRGGACAAVITNPSPAPSPPTAWIAGGIQTSLSTLEEDWTLTWNGTDWNVSGTLSGLQTATATAATPYVSDGGEIAFTLYQDTPSVGTTLEFCTRGADALDSSSTAGADDDADLQVFSGDEITVSYTNVNNLTVVDTADIVAPCEAFIQFTRINGLPSEDFELGSTPAESDELFVTVFLREANADPAVAETIQVTLTGNDTQTLTLTETGVDTGEFRNTAGLATQVSDGAVAAEDGLWEDVDNGTVTATYDYVCLGNNFSVSTTADLFFIDAGGRVAFTNGAGTQDVDLYGSQTPVFVEVTDMNACACTPNACVVTGGINTLQVTVTSPTGDSETVTVYETAPGSGVFVNRRNDLVTTASSAVVTSASSDFIAEGIMAGDTFVVATGPDTGTFTVASVDSATQITLTTTLTATRTNIGFNAKPLIATTFDGAVTANDGVIESNHQDQLTANYTDCDDGDLDATNDVKTDQARYNAPPLILNEVLFFPAGTDDPAMGNCQTESVEILNTSTSAVNATGFSVTDTDAFTYTVPQFGGTDLILQPGERIFLSLYPVGTAPVDFFDTGTYYLFTLTGSTFPTRELEDPVSAGPADQVTLFDSSGVVQDYVGWSATASPPLDFFGDDSPAVLRNIWVDDSFRDVNGMTVGDALRRTPDGFDTNLPADWVFVNNLADCTFITSPARVTSFTLHQVEGRAVARFETATETGTVGFVLERLDERGGQFHRVVPDLVPATMTPQGGVYHVADDGLLGESATYLLTEIEAGPGRSRRIVHGPFTVVSTPAFDPDYSLAGGDVQSASWASSNPQEKRLAEHREARRLARELRGSRVGTRIKMALRDDGLYRLDAAELAGFFDLPAETIEAWIRAGQLRLSHRDGEIAWAPTSSGDGLLFWGAAIDSIYTRDNVYWLEKGQGRVMDEVRAPGGRPSPAAATFLETRRFEEASLPGTTLAESPEADFWFWTFLLGGHPSFGTTRVELPLDGVASNGTAALRVELRGASSTGVISEHHVEARVNGVLVGETRFTGTAANVFDLAFDQALLVEGANELELRGLLDTGAPFSVVFLDAVEIDYQRLYQADDDALLAPAGGESFTAGGFVDPRIRIFEMGDPRSPREVVGVTIDGTAGEVRFKVDDPSLPHLAISPAGFRRPDAVWADAASELASSKHRAEYLVIAPAELADGARELLEYRQSRGLEGELVLLEDVMDEFNGGISDPHAIRDFLYHAHHHWTTAPRWVVLIGSGDVDYLDAMGLGANPMPPLLALTSGGLFAADLRFGDVEGFDGVPEIAVGRIPALTNAEVRAHVDRLRTFEAAAGTDWRSRLLLLADDNPGDDRFARDSESIAAFHVNGGEERFFLARESVGSLRPRLHNEIRRGAGWLHYVGHGGMDRMTDEAVLHSSDVAGLDNGAQPPIVVALSCAINRFGLPGFASLGEVLVSDPQSGAVAVWAPSGLSLDLEATILGQGLFRAAFSHGALRLGDAVLAALEEYSERGSEPEMLLIYNLLGDPALELR